MNTNRIRKSHKQKTSISKIGQKKRKNYFLIYSHKPSEMLLNLMKKNETLVMVLGKVEAIGPVKIRK